MKLILGSTVPLDTRLGAAQTCISLAESIRELGHDVKIFEPPSRVDRYPWMFHLRARRQEFARFVRQHEPVDLIDSVSWMMSPALRSSASNLVVRSIQPDLAYLSYGASPGSSFSLRRLPVQLHDWDVRRLIELGWRSASRILALGTAELSAMTASHPQLAPRLKTYFAAPSTEDRRLYRLVAAGRKSHRTAIGQARILWIGRWARHKGTALLIEFLRTFLPGNPGTRVTLAGTGSAALPELDQAWLKSGQIKVIARFERSELAGILAAHDAGIFTSGVEGWGLSIQEMLESGMPVYATRAGACQDLEGWFPNQLRVFPPRADEALPAQDTEATFARYAEYFDWAAIAERYLRDAVDWHLR